MQDLLDAGFSHTELDADGLSIESVAMGTSLKDINAACEKVPSEDDVAKAFQRGALEFLKSPSELKSSAKVCCPNLRFERQRIM